jgi:hypothetical protein
MSQRLKSILKIKKKIGEMLKKTYKKLPILFSLLSRSPWLTRGIDGKSATCPCFGAPTCRLAAATPSPEFL